MNTLEHQLREYARRADDVSPVKLDEILQAPPAPLQLDPRRTRAGDARRRPTRFSPYVLVAAVCVATVGAIVVVQAVRSGSAPDEVVPMVTTPPTLPPPADPANGPEASDLTPMQFDMGTIVWERIEGDATDLPSVITEVEADGTLMGSEYPGGPDQWRSTDGGRTWSPRTDAELTTTVAGREWVVRSNPDAAADIPPRSLSLVTSDSEVEITPPPLPETIEVPEGFIATTWIGSLETGLPLDVGGDAYATVDWRIAPDWDTITGVSDWSEISIDSESINARTTYGRDGTGPSFQYRERVVPGGGSELVDDDGNVLLAVDGPFPGVSADSTDTLADGVVITRWGKVVGNSVTTVPQPWADGQRVEVSEIAGGAFALTAGNDGSPQQAWFTADGVAWNPVDLTTGPDTTVWTYVDPDGLMLASSTPQGIDTWLTTDGITFTSITLPTMNGQRLRSDFGWVSIERSNLTSLHVGSDGFTWEKVPLTDLLPELEQPGVSDGSVNVSSEVFLDGSTIFLTIQIADDRYLLVGDVTTQ